MSNLESIVPPLELCKLIPEGKFKNSALVWQEFRTGMMYPPTDWGMCARRQADKREVIIPAPTLAEILAELPYETKCEKYCDFAVYCGGSTEEDASPTIAALRLWLKLKGIEVKA